MECAVEIAIHTGWTLHDVYRDLTLPRYNMIQKMWSRWPPIMISSAIAAGYKGPPSDDDDEPVQTELEQGDMAELIQMFGMPLNMPPGLQI